MKKYLRIFEQFVNEAKDPTYYQETFYFTILIVMNKAIGGSRDETKNDIRALPEVLTVTLVEPQKGGVQRDLGTKYLSTLKIHVRRPKDTNKLALMKKVVLHINNLRGVAVLRYKEKQVKPRKKVFRGPGSYKLTEVDYQAVRTKKGAEYAKDKSEYIATGPQKSGGTPFTRPASTKRGKSAPPIVPGGLEEIEAEEATDEVSSHDRLYEDILITLGDENLMAFDIQRTLNPKIWTDDDHVRPGVKGALMDIVEEFLEGLDLEVNLKDIIVTGSIANYNWSKFSDIDLHLLLDFSDINDNEKMVKKFFDAVRSNWNKLHTIKVKGHEVEIYVQADDEPHVSTGVYSLVDDRWLVKPTKIKPELDKANATKKMKTIAREVGKLSAIYDSKQYQEAFDSATRIKEKIKRMRRAGLDRAGIYSPENLAFKMLRRSGDIGQLFSIYTQAYDKLYSMDQ